MANRKRIFTIYDVMEEKGVFLANPANVDSRDNEGAALYKGPVPLPRMIYHPKGEERIIVPATEEMTPFGPKRLGEQREIISRMVMTTAEFREALAQGWHDHPAKAIAAGNALGGPQRPVPPASPSETIEDLRAKLAEAQARLEAAGGEAPDSTKAPPELLTALAERTAQAGLV